MKTEASEISPGELEKEPVSPMLSFRMGRIPFTRASRCCIYSSFFLSDVVFRSSSFRFELLHTHAYAHAYIKHPTSQLFQNEQTARADGFGKNSDQWSKIVERTDGSGLDHVADGESLDGLVLGSAASAVGAAHGLDVAAAVLVTTAVK